LEVVVSELEKELEQWTVDFCKSLGLRCEKLTGPVGWPDRTIFGPSMQGKMAFLEFKTGKGIVSKAQVYQMKWLTGCGHKALVVRTKEEAQRFIESLVEMDDD
jgi:hypothetical protein